MSKFDKNQEEFVRLFVQHQHDLYRYVLALLPNITDAHDVLQETAVALMAKFDEYDSHEPFLPWACRFAYYEVLHFRDRCKRENRDTIFMSQELIEQLANEHNDQKKRLDDRRAALTNCIKMLPDESRKLVHQHYEEQLSIQSIAVQSSKSVHALYKRLSRTRQWLMDCIARRLNKAIEGQS